MPNLEKILKNADKSGVDRGRMDFGRVIQNENGSVIVLIILAFFFSMLLMGSILQNESSSFQATMAAARVATEKSDFANYVYTAFSNSPGICDDTLQLTTNDCNAGQFVIAGLSPGTTYPDPAPSLGPSYLNVCLDATAPCAGPGLTYDNCVALPAPWLQNDFHATFEYYDPSIGQITTNTITFTMQYKIAAAPGTAPYNYTVSNCKIVNTSDAACTAMGLPYCPTQGRCAVCEASGGCWVPASGTCTMGGSPCPLPTPGVGGC